ncbi:MAG: peptidoglycan-binding protein [Solirubrobacteraceae bacterium]
MAPSTASRRRGHGHMSSRRTTLAGIALVLVAAAVALIVTDPFGGPAKPSGVGDNATPTSLATVTQRELSSQTQVSATLGYAGSSSIRMPAGTPPSAVQQAEQSVSSGEGMLQSARASLAADRATLAGAQATVSAAREKMAVDCAGDSAAESASAGSSPGAGGTPGGSTGSPASGEGTPSDAASSDAGSGLCASDAQSVASDAQSSSSDEAKLAGDRASISSAEKALASAEAAVSAARISVAAYGQSSTFTMLPAVGQVIARGQSLYQVSDQPVILLYGSVVPSGAFVAGMSAGRDVAALNANLAALGYATGLSGDAFTAATEAAVRAFQSAHGLSVTGELALGSVVFEPGPVLVTSVTPTVGANVAPGPVLGISSTTPQVTIALAASEQSSVKVGDSVSITLPNNETTPGVVSSVGSVAKSPSTKGGEGGGGGPEGEEGGATIEVDVALRDPSATGHLDEAPVSVSITTANVPSALVVPVDALLALAGGGYAVEVVEGHVHRLEAVTLGLFDDAEGLVQVSGDGVAAGQRVVVPAT